MPETPLTQREMDLARSVQVVCEEIMLRMAQADTPDTARKEGIRIAQEMLDSVRSLVQGVQVSAPFGRYTAAAEVIASVLPEAPSVV